LITNVGFAQIYEDYLGAGNTIGVKVSGSNIEQNDSSHFSI